MPPGWMVSNAAATVVATVKFVLSAMCTVPSVGGGENADGNWSLMAGFCGPGSVVLLGLTPLMAPCGGSSGLPKAIGAFSGAAVAVFMAAAVTTPPTAVAANMSRLDIIAY